MATSSAVANLVLRITAQNHTAGALTGVSRGLASLRTDAALAGAALAAGVAAGTVGAIKSAADFQRTMVQTAALTGQTASAIGASNRQMAAGFTGTSKQVLDAVGQTGQSAHQLGEALYFIASSGFTRAADAEKLMVLSGKDATIGHVDAKVAADALTTSLNAYGQTARSAARYNDILLQGVNLGKAEFGDFARSLGNVLPLAAQAGVRFQDVTAALSTLTLSGLSPRRAAMDLNRLIQSILQPTKGQTQMAVALGIDFTKADLSTPAGLVHFLDLVKSKVAQFPKGEQAAIFKHLFSNQAAILGAQVLTNNLGNLQHNVQVMTQTVGNGTVTTRAYGEVSKTLAVQFDILRHRVGAAAIQLGGVLSPVALRLVQIAGTLLPGALHTLTNLIRAIEHPTAGWRTAMSLAATVAGHLWHTLVTVGHTVGALAGGLVSLVPHVRASHAAFGHAQAAAAGLGTVLGLLIPVVVGYMGTMRVVRAATALWAAAQWLLNAALTANPIGLIVVAIAGLVLALVYAWNHWKGFHTFVVGAWQWLAGVLRPGLQALATFLHGPLSAAWDRAKKAVHDAWYIIRVLWQLIKDNVIPAITAFAHNLQTELVAAWVQTTQKVQVAWDLLKAFWTWLKNVFDLKSVGKNLRDALGGAFEDIKAKITGFLLIWQGALRALEKVPGMGWIKGALHALSQAKHEVDAHDAHQRRASAQRQAAASAHQAQQSAQSVAQARIAALSAHAGAAVVVTTVHHTHASAHHGPSASTRPVDRSATERLLHSSAAGGASSVTNIARDFSTALGYFRASKGLDPADVARKADDIAAMRAQDPVRAAKLQQELDVALAHRRDAIRHQGAVEAHHRQQTARRAAHHAQVVAHHNQVVAHQVALRRANADAATLLRTIHNEIREHRYGAAAGHIARYRVLVEQADRLKGLDAPRAKADADARARTLTDELKKAQHHVAAVHVTPYKQAGTDLAAGAGYGQTTVTMGPVRDQLVAQLQAQLRELKAQNVRAEKQITLLEAELVEQHRAGGLLEGIFHNTEGTHQAAQQTARQTQPRPTSGAHGFSQRTGMPVPV